VNMNKPTPDNENDFEKIIDEILNAANLKLSNIKPSDWAEKNRVMTGDVSPIPGRLSYTNSPYTREIVDCFAPDHPARIIAVKKGAQIGFSTTVIESAIGWIISENPGNILFLIGHDDLVDESINKIDRMIDNSGLRHMIKTTSMRKKNNKTGDTNRKKEFPGGNLIGGVANHKTLRNRSVQYGFIDDFEAMKQSTKEAGSTAEMIEQRFAAYRQKMKLAYISTPELKSTSNIEPVYLLGDQRKFFIPCPCCGEFINLEWAIESEIDKNNMAGIHWEINPDDKTLIPESVGYVCQKCGGKFDDKNKNELLNHGEWRPTAKPSREGYYSYHISSLYAPTYMFDWLDYVYKFLEANPFNQPRIETKQQTFVNLVLGDVYEPPGTSIESKALQLNTRNYAINTIPEKLSLADGNGRIILLTCAADLGGRIAGINGDYDDARIDWEIVAHTESGTTYSINHGSIGTFKPAHMGEKSEHRELYTYDISKPNNVWREFDAILSTIYIVDTGRKMKIQITGIDTGFGEHHVFNYIDKRIGQFNIIGLKGDKEHKPTVFGINTPVFKIGQTRANLYVLSVGQLKDQLANRITLRWDKMRDETQPPGFINFPEPSGGKYGLENYFLHYEAEHRHVDKNNNFIWQKKTSTAQNHFFDVAIYNIACREILTNKVFKEIGVDPKVGTWRDFSIWVLSQYKIGSGLKK
jgi:phage terminase large subunit GpA-like protein